MCVFPACWDVHACTEVGIIFWKWSVFAQALVCFRLLGARRECAGDCPLLSFVTLYWLLLSLCIHTDCAVYTHRRDYSCVLLFRGVAVLFIRAHSAAIGMLKGEGGGEGKWGGSLSDHIWAVLQCQWCDRTLAQCVVWIHHMSDYVPNHALVM